MELVGILRELWRRRLLVVVGALLAAALGAVLVMKAAASTTSVGVASQRLALDTPRSQLVNPAPERAENLGWQSTLAGYALARETAARRIARDLGIPRSQLVISIPSIEDPPIVTPLPERAADAAATRPEPYVLSIGLTPTLPLISLNATAPDRARARRLTEAGAAALRALPASAKGTKPPFVVEVASPIRTKKVTSRPGRAPGVVAGLLAFGLWCAGLLVLPALLRASRGSTRRLRPA